MIQSMKRKTMEILLADRCLKSGKALGWSEQEVRNVIRQNRSALRDCTQETIAPCLQQAIVAEEMKKLLAEAGLNWPARYPQNLASDWQNVFRECKTREDVIQRLKDLNQAISF